QAVAGSGTARGRPGHCGRTAGASRVVLRHPVAIGARCHVADPVTIVEIPQDRGFETGAEIAFRLPAELACQLARVDGVTAIMAGPVGDKGDLIAIRARVARPVAVEQIAYGADHLEISPLRIAADRVGLARPATLDNGCERGAMIADIEPVAD